MLITILLIKGEIMNQKKQKVITTTIRIPYVIWIKLRRLQEVKKIKSIHQTALDGFEIIIKKLENELITN